MAQKKLIKESGFFIMLIANNPALVKSFFAILLYPILLAGE